MLFKKKYPHAVVARKGLVIVLSGIVLGILAIILYNLNSAKHTSKQHSLVEEKVKNSSGSVDTDWYANATVQQPVVPPNQNSSRIVDGVGVQQALSDDDKTAMAAPITKNQIVAAKQDTSKVALPSDADVEHITTDNSDQNRQAEKKAFLQIAGRPTLNHYLTSSLKNPITSYEVQAGTIIPGVLITGLNSDLPGQIIGQVKSNVYDSISGRHLLIPQGARLVGLYDSQIVYGQQRVLIAWKRIIFPNGQSIDLQGMPGIDLGGYAGFHDQVDNHYGKIFGSVLLMSILSAGAQLSQPQQTSNNPNLAPSVNQMVAQSLGTNIANVGTSMLSKDLNIQPTLIIRPGYEFNINVTKDMIFPSAYADR